MTIATMEWIARQMPVERRYRVARIHRRLDPLVRCWRCLRFRPRKIEYGTAIVNNGTCGLTGEACDNIESCGQWTPNSVTRREMAANAGGQHER